MEDAPVSPWLGKRFPWLEFREKMGRVNSGGLQAALRFNCIPRKLQALLRAGHMGLRKCSVSEPAALNMGPISKLSDDDFR